MLLISYTLYPQQFYCRSFAILFRIFTIYPYTVNKDPRIMRRSFNFTLFFHPYLSVLLIVLILFAPFFVTFYVLLILTFSMLFLPPSVYFSNNFTKKALIHSPLQFGNILLHLFSHISHFIPHNNRISSRAEGLAEALKSIIFSYPYTFSFIFYFFSKKFTLYV